MWISPIIVENIRQQMIKAESTVLRLFSSIRPLSIMTKCTDEVSCGDRSHT